MSFFKKFTFPGGVHPQESKELTAEKPIEPLGPPKIAYLPLAQHIGNPAQALVKAGDTVGLGDLIGEASGFVSVPIHASVSGKVIAVENRLSPLGRKVPTIVIERDDQKEKDFPKIEFTAPARKQEYQEGICRAGIVGMGGATFPTHVKLSPPPDKKIDTLIINGAECEPFLTCDYRIMLERSEALLKGVMLMKSALSVEKVVIGIEKNKPQAIAKLRELSRESSIGIVELEVKYPQGAEKQLIYATTKREVPCGKLPMDVGIVVQNIGTAIAVYDYFYHAKPLIERVVTVSGPGIRQPKNLRVRIGTPIRELIEFCGGLTEDTVKVINGGPMMGITLTNLDVPVIKGTSGIIALTAREAAIFAEQPCISCGHCVDVCPMNLLPTAIMKHTKKANWDEAQNQGALDCMECGSCAYVCPAKINLVHYIRLCKAEVMQQKRQASAKKGATNG